MKMCVIRMQTADAGKQRQGFGRRIVSTEIRAQQACKKRFNVIAALRLVFHSGGAAFWEADF